MLVECACKQCICEPYHRTVQTSLRSSLKHHSRQHGAEALHDVGLHQSQNIRLQTLLRVQLANVFYIQLFQGLGLFCNYALVVAFCQINQFLLQLPSCEPTAAGKQPSP